MQETELVLRGREAFARRAWPDAFESLRPAVTRAEVRGDDPELASYLRIEERRLEAVERTSASRVALG